MATADEAAIEQLISELVEAWNRGDAEAYGARYRPDGTFTNVNGAFYVGREEFNRRHEEIFRGYLQGTTLAMEPRLLRFLRPDIAVADIGLSLSGMRAEPPGVAAGPGGKLRTCLLMVLVKDGGSWWIAAYHNVWRSAAADDAAGHRSAER